MARPEEAQTEEVARPTLTFEDAPLPAWARGSREAFDQFANWRRRTTHNAWSLAVQVPKFLLLLVVYSPRGLFRLAGVTKRFLIDQETADLAHKHAVGMETAEWEKVQKRRQEKLRTRWWVSAVVSVLVSAVPLAYLLPWGLAGLVGLLVLIGVVLTVPGKNVLEYVAGAGAGAGVAWVVHEALVRFLPPLPVWPLAVVGGLAVLALGWVGRPDDRKLVKAATPLAAEKQRLTAPMVTDALCSLGNSRMKEPEQILLLMDVAKVGPGWQIDLELPPGVPATWVIEHRSELAAALRREIGCVWPEVGSRHEAHLALYVAEQAMSKARQAAWPLAKSGQVNVFQPSPMFTSKQNQWVDVTLAYTGWVVGAVPRVGKSFWVREWLLVMGLDPRTKVYAFDLKGTGDLSPTAQFAHVHELGDEDDEIESQLRHLRAIRQEMRRRTKVIRELPREEAPENKVTDTLASRRDLHLEPIAVAADECQIWFEHPNKEIRQEFIAICTDLVKRGPALGIMPLFATQKPDAKSIPTAIADNASARVAFKVNGQVSNDQILGTSMYKNGVRATQFAFEDKGVGYFKGDGAEVQIVRTVAGLDAPTAEKVAKRARAIREAQGRLTGQAAAQDDDEQVVFLDDVRAVFSTSQAMHLGDIRSGLERRRPDLYGHLDNGSLSAQLRRAQVKVDTVYVSSKPREESTAKGVKREWLETATEGAEAVAYPPLRPVRDEA